MIYNTSHSAFRTLVFVQNLSKAMAKDDESKSTVLRTALEKGWIGGTSGAAAMTVQVITNESLFKYRHIF